MRFSLSRYAALALLTACTPPTAEQSETGTAAIIAQVESQTDAAWKAAEQVNVTALFEDLIEGEDALFVNQGGLHRSRDSILAATHRAVPFIERQAVEVTERHTHVLSPTAAVLSERGVQQAWLKNGAPLQSPYARTLVYTWQNGRWRIVHGHQSLPPQAP